MIIELSGLPKSGKTTIARTLRDYFVRHGYRVIERMEPAHSCPFPHLHRVETAAWVASKALADVIEASVNHKDSLVIMDRGLFDSLAFLCLLVKEGIIDGQGSGISEQDINVFTEHSARWGYLVDLIIILDIEPEEAFSRDLADRMNAPPSRTVSNLNTMRILRDVYKDVMRNYASSFGG